MLSVTVLFWVALVRPSIALHSQPKSEKIIIGRQNLYRHVEALSREYSPRNYSNIDNLNAAAAYIKRQFENIGHEVIVQKYRGDNEAYKNVMINLGPQGGPKLVIGAHYDAAGPFPGADDNASGVAGLIELARLLKDEPLNKGVTLIAYTLEEPPFFGTGDMGSYIHAQSERENDVDIELMISLEMIGYFTEEENSQSFPMGILSLFYPDKGNFIAVIDQLFSDNARKVKVAMSKNSSIPVYSMNAPVFVPGVDFSDHRNYWAQGYDAVMVTDTAFYRNEMYHTEGDTLDRLDFDKMGEVIKGVYGFIKLYSEIH
ncbi:MAG: M28 family peptidase [Proteobacteria bacterium]|nr:M28 family peptidase [Pseudomonadota bacterium]